ncbi:unnamed protein product, partial [marine sediment metagenome]
YEEGETGIIGTKYTFSTSTTDQDMHQIYYLFDWGDDTNSGWLGPEESGKAITDGHIYKEARVYSVKVKAKDEYDAESEWSNKYTIIIGNIAPDKPGKPTVNPKNGKVGDEFYFTTSTKDPNKGDTLFYLFDWGDGTDSGWFGKNNNEGYPSDQTISASHSYDKTGSYKVTVKAKDQKGEESHWSDPVTATVKKNKDDPVDPIPVNPTPVNPTPVNPTPVNPTPVNPTPVNPTPVNPTPVNPTPVNPTPV